MSPQQEQEANADDGIALSIIATQDLYEEFLDRIEAVVPEAIFQATPDGLEVQAVGPAQVAMIDATLAGEECESYDASEYRVGVDINRLGDVIGLADDGDALIELTYEDDGKFHADGPDFHATVSGIDPEQVRQPPDIPDLELPAKCTIAGSKLKRAANGVDMVTDTVTVEWRTDDGALVVWGEGDLDDVDFDFDADDGLESVEHRPDEDIGSMLSIDYLNDLVDGLDAGRDVQVELGDAMPMWMHQDFADGCPCTYMIAPRIPSGGG